MVFAIQAGSAPPGATKLTHNQVRDLFKACVLAVQYGMSALSLSKRINQSVADARWLLDLHHHTYRVFWKWSDAASDFARLHGYLYTVFGWLLHLSGEINGRSLRTEEMATIDLKQFTLDTACVPRGRATQVGRPSRHARGVYFLKGPVPWSWLQKAMSLPGRALHVSLYLWWQAGMNKKHEVSVSLSRITRETGVPRLTLVRGLKTLEQAGLVSVLRHSGRKPQVTILDTDSRDE